MFETKKLNSLSLAEILRGARTSQGLSLKRASELTDVQLKYLKMLEEGDFENLPAPIYVTNFLKKYGTLLKIDSDFLIEHYKNEKKFRESLTGKISGRKPSLPFPFLTPRILSFLIGLLALCSIICYLIFQLSFIFKGPSFEIYSPAQESFTTDEDIIIVKGKSSSSDLTINEKKIYVDKNGGFQEEVTLNEGLNSISIESKSSFGKSSKKVLEIVRE